MKSQQCVVPLYFHLQLCNSASFAATALTRLWKQSAHVKLLQQPLARKISSKLASVLQLSAHHLVALADVLTEATPFCSDLVERGHPEYGHDLVAAVMEAKPVSTIAQLLVWLQQQPDMLRLHAWSEDDGFFDYGDNAGGDVAAACTTSSSSSNTSRSTSTTSSSSSSSSSGSGSYGGLWLSSAIGKHKTR
jgi:uncharacterized membrane protein YgcG